MIVVDSDSYLEVSGEIVTVADFGSPVDPVAAGFTEGVYLVGYDIEPGRYRVADDDLSYTANLLPALAQGYSRNRESAGAMLRFLEDHFSVDGAMRAEIVALLDDGEV